MVVVVVLWNDCHSSGGDACGGGGVTVLTVIMRVVVAGMTMTAQLSRLGSLPVLMNVIKMAVTIKNDERGGGDGAVTQAAVHGDDCV